MNTNDQHLLVGSPCDHRSGENRQREWEGCAHCIVVFCSSFKLVKSESESRKLVFDVSENLFVGVFAFAFNQCEQPLPLALLT